MARIELHRRGIRPLPRFIQNHPILINGLILLVVGTALGFDLHHGDPASALRLTLPALLFLVVSYVAPQERLLIDETGIRYISPLKPLGWQLHWSALRSVHLAHNRFNTHVLRLILDTGLHRRQVIAMNWVEQPTAQRHVYFRRPPLEQRVESALSSPLAREISARGFRIDTAPLGGERESYALESNPYTAISLVALVALLFSAALFAVITLDTYAGEPPWGLFVIAGGLMALAWSVWLYRCAIPMLESLGLGALVGAALGIALYPGLLAFAAYDPGSTRTEYRYVIAATHRLHPVSADAPPAPLDGFEYLLSSLGEGAEMKLTVVTSRFGTTQFEMAPIYEQQWAALERKANDSPPANAK